MLVSVIGLGNFGAKVATKLADKGIEVIAIDSNSELVEKIKDLVTHAITVDVTDEKALRAVNISDIDVAIVAIGDNIQMSIMAVAMLRKLGVGRIIARATNQLHENVLIEIGASEIVKVEEQMGNIIASKIVAPYIIQQYSFASGFSLVQLKLGKKFHKKTIAETQIKTNYSLNIVALEKKVPYVAQDGKSSFRVEINEAPLPMDEIHADDIIAIVGSDKNFDRLFKDLSK